MLRILAALLLLLSGVAKAQLSCPTSQSCSGWSGDCLSVTCNGTNTVGVQVSATGTGSYAIKGSAFSYAAADGVQGYSSGRNGVAGKTVSSSASGVYGEAGYDSGYGVAGRSGSSGQSGTGTAVLGDNICNQSSCGWAGYFTGRVYVAGLLSKGGGGFIIDHPLAPETKTLEHSFVESDEMKNFYDGTIQLDAQGHAVVALPAWFEALNRDFRYQLTPLGQAAGLYVAREISGNSFEIAGGQSGQRVSWSVTGVRKDAFANRYRIQVESNKSEPGKYHHPECFGAGEDRRLKRSALPAALPLNMVTAP